MKAKSTGLVAFMYEGLAVSAYEPAGSRTLSGAFRKANGFKNCLRQNKARSTALKPASSQMDGHSFSIVLTWWLTMAIAASDPRRKDGAAAMQVAIWLLRSLP
jgi:hypothetical protein